MKAALYEGNHTFSVVEKEANAPQAGGVRIKVAYCGVCGTDVHIYHGMMDKRVSIPLSIGHEMSGTIDAIGEGVTGFNVGEKVVVRPLDNRDEKPSDKGFSHICEDLKFIGIDSPGAMQQFWNVPAFTLHKLSEETDLKLAALIEPLAVACHDVRLSGLQSNETAVINGQWVNSESKSKDKIINPTDESIVGTVQNGTAKGAHKALVAAEKVQYSCLFTWHARITC